MRFQIFDTKSAPLVEVCIADCFSALPREVQLKAALDTAIYYGRDVTNAEQLDSRAYALHVDAIGVVPKPHPSLTLQPGMEWGIHRWDRANNHVRLQRPVSKGTVFLNPVNIEPPSTAEKGIT